MFIVWQGLGFLGVVIPVGLIILVNLVFGKGFSENTPYLTELILILSAISIWFVGKHLNGMPGKELVDPKTNEVVVLKPRHSLFWIPLQWFSVVILAISVLVLSKHFG